MNRVLLAGAIVICSVVVFIVFHEMSTSNRRSLDQLTAELATDERTITDTQARISRRDVSLRAELKEIVALKNQTRTPAAVISELPKYLPLPRPITITKVGDATNAVPPLADSVRGIAGVNNGVPIDKATAVATLPTEDLKPLFDFVQDCRVCQQQLQDANQNAADNLQQMEILRRERDAAVSAEKGGSIFRRVRRNMRWLLAGAAAGYFAARSNNI